MTSASPLAGASAHPPATGPATGPDRPGRRQRRRLAWGLAVLLAAALVALAAWLGHRLGHERGLAALRQDAGHRLELAAASAHERINRHEHLAATVQLHPLVQALFPGRATAAARAAASDYLRRLSAHQGGAAVFVADQRGEVLASSSSAPAASVANAANAADTPAVADDSAIGQDLSYRPYFQDALSGRAGRHYAVGTPGSEPGYYFSHPIRAGQQVLGVAVVKVALTPLNDTLALLGSPAAVIDGNQVVVMATEPAWLYAALRPLSTEQRVDLELTGMYGGRRLGRFPLLAPLRWDEDSQSLDQLLPGGALALARQPAGTLVQGRTLDGMDWRLLVFSDLAPVRWRAQLAAWLAALATALALLAALTLWQRRQAQATLRRLNAALEDTVARRTQALRDTNVELRREMAERVQAEATLRAAQDDLVQAAKLAVLGQLSAGITHELAQPLGAIRGLAGNARQFLRRADTTTADSNLAMIDTLVEKMAAIIQPLKTFARKAPSVPEAVPLPAALHSALFLLDQRLRAADVDVQCDLAPDTPAAWCNRNRLEQVLVNLLGNAIDAVQGRPQRQVRVTAAAADGGRVRLTVSDTGPGFSDAVLAQLFTPFFTTKPPGGGLGLGLVISRGIAQDAGGELGAGRTADGGACFTLLLPAAPAAAAAPAVVPPPASPATDTAA